MDYKNDQKLRKTSNANVLQNFAFAGHIVSHNVEDTPKWTRKCSHNVSGIPLTMWRTNVNEDAYGLILLSIPQVFLLSAAQILELMLNSHELD